MAAGAESPRNVSARGPRFGTVVAFDQARGLGTIASREGRDGGEWGFHCTAIADGTRTIAAGTAVVFDVVPGHLGRMEAARVTVLEP